MIERIENSDSYGYDLYKELCKVHGKKQINYLAMFSILQGMWIMELICVQYIFREVYQISPSEMALYFLFIVFPQPLKFIFGIISDKMPICGYKRKPYIFIFGLLISICFITLFFKYYQFSAFVITIVMMIASACISFMGTVTDAVCCMIAKKDYQLGT